VNDHVVAVHMQGQRLRSRAQDSMSSHRGAFRLVALYYSAGRLSRPDSVIHGAILRLGAGYVANSRRHRHERTMCSELRSVINRLRGPTIANGSRQAAERRRRDSRLRAQPGGEPRAEVVPGRSRLLNTGKQPLENISSRRRRPRLRVAWRPLSAQRSRLGVMLSSSRCTRHRTTVSR
jgi:hypothetical protein